VVKKEQSLLYYVKSEFRNRTVFRLIRQNYYIIKVSANTRFATQIGGFRLFNICLHGPANFFNNPMNVILSREYFLFLLNYLNLKIIVNIIFAMADLAIWQRKI
jgi:hypothetical protein